MLRITSFDLDSVLRWGLVLGTFAFTVHTVSSCTQQRDSEEEQRVEALVSQGYDPIIARCAVMGSSNQSGTSTTCALAVQAEAYRKLTKESRCAPPTTALGAEPPPGGILGRLIPRRTIAMKATTAPPKNGRKTADGPSS